MSAHSPARLKRKPAAQHRRARTGTPGWVIWCCDYTYPPTPDVRQALEWLRLAQTNGCPARHEMRPVLIAQGGQHFRYVNRKDIAS